MYLCQWETKMSWNPQSQIPKILKGQSHEKVGEMRVWGDDLGPN
jgi:hypothetical protein